MKSRFFRAVVTTLLLAGISACATNPVTGKREFSTVSESDEIRIGEENYAMMQQSGGGEYDIDPALTSYVQGIGNRLAAVSDRQLPYEFVVLNSSVPNAWALPGGKIAVNRGLLTEINSEAELAAVIGHEIVHAAAKHSARQMSRGTLLQAAVIGTAILSSGTSYSDLVVGGANVGAQLINQTYGRGAELESDLYGMRYMSKAGYDPQGAVTLQETFVRLSEGRDSDWLGGLFASHPPSQERVDTNKRTATTLPAGGEMGVESFRAAMKKTVDIKPAYDAYDEGRKALSEEDTDLAVQKAEQAIGLFPDEAHFYALRGDARYADERYEDAVTNYDSAIRRRDDFFQYYLQRGRANERLEDYESAVTDLEKSNELFPTAVAYYSLGNIAAKQGNTAKAIEHYTVVAQSSGELAEAAQRELAILDLERNPDKYLQVRCFQDSNSTLGISIGNGTPVTVAGVRYAVQNSEGSVAGEIPPGRAVNVSTGLGPYSGGSCPVRITAARVVE